MAEELHEKLSEYIGFKPEQIRMPITAEDQDLFRKLITEQEQITDIVIGEYQDLLHYGCNSKGGKLIHIAWVLGITQNHCEKVLERVPTSDKIAKKVLAHLKRRFDGIPLAPIILA